MGILEQQNNIILYTHAWLKRETKYEYQRPKTSGKLQRMKTLDEYCIKNYVYLLVLNCMCTGFPRFEDIIEKLFYDMHQGNWIAALLIHTLSLATTNPGKVFSSFCEDSGVRIINSFILCKNSFSKHGVYTYIQYPQTAEIG